MAAVITTAAQTRSAAIDSALAKARAAYAVARPKSAALHEAAGQALAGGNTRSVLHFLPFPFRIERAADAWLEDIDGNRATDLLGDYSAGLYGHSHPTLRRAIDAALDAGLSHGACNRHEVALAEAIVGRFAGIERVRFTSSGTEANLYALSLARAVTGRRKVLVFDGAYHGGALSFSGKPSPLNAPYEFVVAQYNDATGARAMIDAHRRELAAVIVEPMLGSAGCIPAENGFLALLRESCDKAGSLLIFDEVMTSRLAPAGLQSVIGVRPDLTTFGKYLGGGLSFGAFGGRLELMNRFEPGAANAITHPGTFNNNVLSMAAGAVGLAEVFTPEVAVALNTRGDRLRQELAGLLERRGVAMQVTGIGSLMNFHPLREPIRRASDLARADARLRDLLFHDLLAEGFYIAPRGYVALSLALTDVDLDCFVQAVDQVLGRRDLWRVA